LITKKQGRTILLLLKIFYFQQINTALRKYKAIHTLLSQFVLFSSDINYYLYLKAVIKAPEKVKQRSQLTLFMLDLFICSREGTLSLSVAVLLHEETAGEPVVFG
jgi:hypothetical protein